MAGTMEGCRDGGKHRLPGDGRAGTLPAMDDVFSWRETKDGTVMIDWRGRTVTILRGGEAASFVDRAARLDRSGRQLLMARLTGNFKRGNERRPAED
jgi:hypothetical protein